MGKSLSAVELDVLRGSALSEVKGNLEILSCVLCHWPILGEDFESVAEGFSWIVQHCLNLISDMESNFLYNREV
jgi:hypothetical protein